MEALSRRVFLKYAAMLGLVTWSTTPLYAKVPKATFKYQDMPNDGKNVQLVPIFFHKPKSVRWLKAQLIQRVGVESMFRKSKFFTSYFLILTKYFLIVS
ncbi:hypothetical protein [Sulfurimonas sp.]|uniref:hypothetical protein n=1 Tax=Sulfurimonas sp. TaxID=2022749 RepID=UPI0025F51AAB|nr:hypothetical protein [Sulfurimonas sp.]MDD5156919.1 hypothetical protein [Sulfurimonas sp.]